MQQTAASSLPWYKHRWPWLLMLGPALVVIAGVYTTWLAMAQPDALVVDDYYKQGKAINQDLRRDQAAATLGMHVDMRYDAADGKLAGFLSSHDRPVQALIRIKLVHSTLPEKDMLLIAQTGADGKFALSLPMLDIARWHVQVEGENGNWRLAGVWTWPSEKTVALDAIKETGSES